VAHACTHRVFIHIAKHERRDKKKRLLFIQYNPLAMIVTASKRCISSQARRFSIVSISNIPNSSSSSSNASALSAFRLHSSATNKSCPRQAKSEGATATSIASATNVGVELVDIPKLPFIGSMIPQYSNSVPYEFDKVYDYWYESRERFGDFYCMGFPGMGKHITGDSKQYRSVVVYGIEGKRAQTSRIKKIESSY
jgi:hypothetical protein